jgi:HD-like signal output (HDOD) protein/CRP-like cAMP-binding protein
MSSTKFLPNSVLENKDYHMTTPADKAKGSGFDLKQQIKFLKKIEFFDNFDNHELKQFLSVSRWLKVAKGTQIIKENTRERAFYILVKGEVSVKKTAPGKKTPIKLTTLSAGDCFGEMSLVMDVKRTADIVTDTECFILMVEPGIINTSNVFLQLKFYKRFCEVLVSRLIVANKKMADLEQTVPTDVEPPGEEPREKTAGVDKAEPVAAEKHGRHKKSLLSEETVMVLPPMPGKKDKLVKSKVKRLIKTSIDLPFNPSIANRLAPHLQGECENTRAFADLIQLDPAFSSKVLQIANSSYFRRSTPVATVAHSLITVGIKQVQEALIETIETTAPQKPFSGFNDVSLSFWRHSILVARIADMLKEVIRVNLSSDIYLAGLLHDLGILALDQIEPNFYPNLVDPGSSLKKNLSDSETDFIGVDHGQAGCWYGESIGLPQSYLDVIAHHHFPEKAGSNAVLVALVHLADLFAMLKDFGVGGRDMSLNFPNPLPGLFYKTNTALFLMSMFLIL